MLRRLSILIASGALVLAVGGGAAFAGDKAGAVNVTSTSTCDADTLLLQDNQFSGTIYIWLHDPSASGDKVTVTYHKTGDSFDFYLSDYICQFDGWFLYADGSTTQAGATSVAVFEDVDGTWVKIGGDSFLSTFVE